MKTKIRLHGASKSEEMVPLARLSRSVSPSLRAWVAPASRPASWALMAISNSGLAKTSLKRRLPRTRTPERTYSRKPYKATNTAVIRVSNASVPRLRLESTRSYTCIE